MMIGNEELQKELELIKQRNKRVEADKAWETSNTRKISVAVLTYIVILIFFLIIKVTNPYVSAIVPTLGFLLSTMGLGKLKKIWIKKMYIK